jgi:wyosine [tRNA(Phe)-imidazoG37] synthetase (radical SAM superfamily)
VNRPHPDLDPEWIVKELIDLRKEYRNELWIEIFIVPGLNDTDSELYRLSEAVKRIGPDKVQLNTLDRPGTESWVRAAEKSELERIQRHFDRLEIVEQESCKKMILADEEKDVVSRILQLVGRRPCTCDDMMKSQGVEKIRLDEVLARLVAEGKIHLESMARGDFYRIS